MVTRRPLGEDKLNVKRTKKNEIKRGNRNRNDISIRFEIIIEFRMNAKRFEMHFILVIILNRAIKQQTGTQRAWKIAFNVEPSVHAAKQELEKSKKNERPTKKKMKRRTNREMFRR